MFIIITLSEQSIFTDVIQVSLQRYSLRQVNYTSANNKRLHLRETEIFLSLPVGELQAGTGVNMTGRTKQRRDLWLSLTGHAEAKLIRAHPASTSSAYPFEISQRASCVWCAVWGAAAKQKSRETSRPNAEGVYGGLCLGNAIRGEFVAVIRQ